MAVMVIGSPMENSFPEDQLRALKQPNTFWIPLRNPINFADAKFHASAGIFTSTPASAQFKLKHEHSY